MSLPDGYSDVPPGRIASVVTHLQMTARPLLRPEQSGPWTLRCVADPDLDWFRDLYGRVGAEWLWFSRLLMTDDDLRAVIHAPLVEVYALSSEGSDEGLLELDFRNNGDCELAFFGVTARLIGGGSGRWLMNRALELAWSRPIDRLWVHTCTSDHPTALAFYQRSGFVPFRRQIEIADDPRLDGTGTTYRGTAHSDHRMNSLFVILASPAAGAARPPNDQRTFFAPGLLTIFQQ